MTISGALSLMANNVAISLAFAALIGAALVWYAMYKKGDVRAVFSHGKTVFKLEAKERHANGK